MRSRTRLILALDVTEESKALRLAADTRDYVDAFKVNYPLVLARGMGVVEKLAKTGDVICDFKVADIPNTNRLIVDQVFRRHAKGVIVHGFVGEDSVRACVDATKGGDVFVVAEMSHPGAETWNAPIADDLARLAVTVGAAGIVAPATRPERVKHLRGIVGDRLILAPGAGGPDRGGRGLHHRRPCDLRRRQPEGRGREDHAGDRESGRSTSSSVTDRTRISVRR